MTNIKAASVREPALSRQKLKDLCADYYAGFCRRGDNCKKSHEVCGVIDGSPQTMKPEIWSAPNYLSLEPRVSPSSGQGFDGDLPGLLSNDGARHQNDYVDIHHINILPTMDEILSRRAPFVPKKDQHHGHFLPRGQARLMDTNFRQLRYENTESLIDICYHASQRLVALTSEPQLDDYDDRNETPNGNQYFMFRNVEFEELQFHERKGIEIRVSFSCPAELRGLTLGSSGRFDRGRLAALIGLDKDHTSLSVTFLEITQPESTNAMKVQTGHDLRGMVLP